MLQARDQEARKSIAISAGIRCVESALEPHNDRSKPIFGEFDRAGCPESRNRFPDVAFFMNACSMLIGLAGF